MKTLKPRNCHKKFLELHLYLLLDKEISKQCRLRLFEGWITLSYWINPYPVDSAVRFILTSPLVSDLSVGQRSVLWASEPWKKLIFRRSLLVRPCLQAERKHFFCLVVHLGLRTGLQPCFCSWTVVQCGTWQIKQPMQQLQPGQILQRLLRHQSAQFACFDLCLKFERRGGIKAQARTEERETFEIKRIAQSNLPYFC